ncbi:MAG: hypothetical protein QXQ79_00125 [Candidatus Nanoarchaeia archaeon]
MQKYKIKYKFKSPDGGEYILYKYYTPRQAGIRGFLATFCAAVSVALLTPLPDEFITVPAAAKLVQYFIDADYETSLVYGYFLYKGIGILFLVLASIFGMQYLRAAWAKKLADVDFTFKKIKRTLRLRRV